MIPEGFELINSTSSRIDVTDLVSTNGGKTWYSPNIHYVNYTEYFAYLEKNIKEMAGSGTEFQFMVVVKKK